MMVVSIYFSVFTSHIDDLKMLVCVVQKHLLRSVCQNGRLKRYYWMENFIFRECAIIQSSSQLNRSFGSPLERFCVYLSLEKRLCD